MADLSERLLRAPPFHRFLDVRLVRAAPGEAVVRVPWRAELEGNPLIHAYHGGITASLIDLAGGLVLWAELGIPTPTIDMRIDYLRPALAGGDLYAGARKVRLGATVAFVDAWAWQGADDREAAGAKLVATGRCVYSVKEQGSAPPPGAGPIG